MWPLDSGAIGSLLHLWLSCITFMVVLFITFMVSGSMVFITLLVIGQAQAVV